ncbi:MAG: DUF5615 family PIN-like protein, partial [Candidatus Nanohaloarchaea archaeon]|nr:DUF5615 family PIN-like protein [Candidatus Nanohaloarchaea archaeon]
MSGPFSYKTPPTGITLLYLLKSGIQFALLQREMYINVRLPVKFMKLIADEDIDRPLIKKLRSRGHDVLSVDEVMKSASDEEVMEKAESTGRILLTFNRDFISEAPEKCGIIRITSVAPYSKIVRAISDVMDNLEKEEIVGEVINVTPL